ncbi:CFDP2 protein, partial [Acromyrmex insinuator]
MVGAKCRIASWNVCSLLITGKLANVVKEINRMKIDILGISKSRWTNNGACYYKRSNLTRRQTNMNVIIGATSMLKYVTEGVTDRFGLGLRNEIGDLLIQFYKEKDLVIKNIYYDFPSRRLYTWKTPQDKDTHIVRNQIDYLIINKRFQNNIKRVATYPGSDIGSDHNPLIADFKFRGKLITQKMKSIRLNIQALKEDGYREQVKDRMDRECQRREDIQGMSMEDQWTSIKLNIQRSAKEILSYEKREAKKS